MSAGRPQEAVEIRMTALESAMSTVNSQPQRLGNLRQLVHRLGTHAEPDGQQGLRGLSQQVRILEEDLHRLKRDFERERAAQQAREQMGLLAEAASYCVSKWRPMSTKASSLVNSCPPN